MGSLTASTQGVKSVGGFMIVSGIGLSLATGFIFWDLSKNQANKTLSFITWILGIVVLLLNFTCGVLTAQVYTPAAAVLRQLGMSPSAVGRFGMTQVEGWATLSISQQPWLSSASSQGTLPVCFCWPW